MVAQSWKGPQATRHPDEALCLFLRIDGSGTWILFFYEHTSDRETQGQVRGQVSSIVAMES